tara:strand:- start:385 stop:828 length:444 start_codon:yes stop_codon:yes gene_type:complete
MKKHLHTIISIIIAIFFIYKGIDKFNDSVSELNKTDLKNIENEKYIDSPKGEKPSGYKITMNTMKQSGFMKMIGMAQILAGILIIIPVSRIYGLLLLLPIIFNVFMMHLFFDNRIDENILTGGLLLTNILLISYYNKLLFKNLILKK